VNRREFITLLGGAVTAWPIAARAQQTGKVRRIGVLMNIAADDPQAPARVGAFAQGLAELGWTIGRNVQIEYRWAPGDAERRRRSATELVELPSDVILAVGGLSVGPLLQVTRAVPIVFVEVTDPVGGGLVASLARPGGNATGFSGSEYGVSAKWLELLKEIAPGVTRVAVLRNPTIAGAGQLGAMQGAASSLGIELRPIDPGNAAEIESVLTTFAHEPNGGLVVPVGGLALIHRDLIISLANRHRLPAVYPIRHWVVGGGLMSYGPDTIDQYRRVATYVDRILKGEKPADLPVQAPTKYELVINLKTAKALGIEVPPTLLARADEVIE
jgi:putative ABC transport system substrate-binding protein